MTGSAGVEIVFMFYYWNSFLGLPHEGIRAAAGEAKSAPVGPGMQNMPLMIFQEIFKKHIDLFI
jgi:hypothetical protein